jgi:ATP adenylyltransferase
MNTLWAPWRIQYVAGEREPGCFLCVKSGQADDERNLILIRERNCFAILNAFPYNPGHLMVSPYKHTGELDDLSEQELSEMMLLTRRCQQILKRALRPDGFNIGINFGRCAGAGVLDHVHIHIVPRWNGDVNFMPVLGETRVLPQALAETHAQLRQHL